MVIFDFNGTMVFDAPYHFDAWYEFSKKIRGIPMDKKELNDNCHGRVNAEIIKYLDPTLSEEECQKLSKEKEALYRKIASNDINYHLVDGLSDFMDYLKANNIKMNVASASIKENIDFFVEYFNLSRWMDPAKIKYDDGTYKDKKMMFTDAAKIYGEDIKNCIIFEDSTSGVKCARDIGVETIIVICEQDRIKDFKDYQIKYFISDFKDPRIYEIVGEINND